MDNGGAGVFHLEVIPCTETSYQNITVGQMSIKALSKTPPLTLTITYSGSSASTISYTAEADNSADIRIDVSSDAVPTYQTIVTNLDADGTVGPIIDATVNPIISKLVKKSIMSSSSVLTILDNIFSSFCVIIIYIIFLFIFILFLFI